MRNKDSIIFPVYNKEETLNNKGTKREHIAYIDFVNVIAMVFVLILHTNGCFWDFSATEAYWRSANFIECICYPAVPMFFMITGITLMDFYDRTTLKEYFIKRVTKTVIPFIAWSLIGLVKRIIGHSVTLEQLSIKYIYQEITGTEIISFFWFFTSLFCIYLCMPLFAAVDKSKRKEVFTYLVVAAFILDIGIPFVKEIFKLDINTPYHITIVAGSLFWIPVGWLLGNCSISRENKAIIYFFALVGLSMHIIGTEVLSMRAGEIVDTYKGYVNVPCVLYSVGMFILLKDIGSRLEGKIKLYIEWLSSYCFPIYLMQFIFLETFPHFFNTRSIVYRLGMPLVIIPIIVFITWVMRKIPVIRRIVP